MPPRYEIVRFDALPGLILVSAEYDSHASVPHAYGDAGLAFCADGLDEFHCGDFHGPVEAGSILAIEAGQIHYDRARHGRIRMIYAPEAHVGGPFLFEKPVVQDTVLWAAADRLFGAPHPSTWAEFRNVWEARPWVTHGRRPPSRFSALLERLSQEVPSLRSVAAEAGLSSSAFLRRFRKEVGCTPAEYSRQARLARAAASLQKGADLAPAAVEHEFFDQSHFTRHFHRIYSVPPGEFRERNSVQS